MLIYVLDELSYDRHFDDAQQVYRVSMVHEGERAFNSAWTTTTLGYAFKEKYPDVEAFTTFQKYWKGFSVKQNGNELPVQTTYLASDDFLELFTFDLLAGDRNQVLKSPENIVLSSDLAHRLFASVDVLGESIETTFGEKVISGVLAPVTKNSHLEAPDVIIPIVGFNGKHDVLQDWTRDAAYYNYIRLRNGTAFSGIREKLEAGGKDFAERWMRESNSGGGQLGEGQVRLEFQRITDIHLFSHKEFEIKPNGNPLYVYIFSTVAILLLFIASINYINLTTATSSGRAREVGIRKTLGSRCGQLVRQFMTESGVVMACSCLVSLLLVVVMLPWFNSLAGRTFTLSDIFTKEVAFILSGIAMITTFFGGFYPAGVMSRYKPVDALKGKLPDRGKNIPLRKGLMIVQFMASTILIACTFAAFLQLEYANSRDLGFDKEHVVAITVEAHDDRQKIPVLKDAIASMPEVSSVGLTAQLPGGNNIKAEPFMLETASGVYSERIVQYAFADSDLLPVLGLTLSQGRNFRPNGADASGASVIVNEMLVKSMGWDHPIGKRVKLPIGKDAEVVGVIHDFHVQSLHDQIQPFFLIHMPEWSNVVLVKFSEKAAEKVLERVEAKYKEVLGHIPFNYTFLDQTFQKQYHADEQRGKLFAVFSGITIAIASLGLFALLGFSVSRRTKEIVIRTVMGASRSAIFTILSKDYIKLITVAVLFALPASWVAINGWLQTFSYRIAIGWWVLAAPAALVLLLSIVVMVVQLSKAVGLNPVEGLRHE
jgi:putative ABC transport system permease protein